MNLLRSWVLVAAVALTPACSPNDFLADFVGSSFGTAGAEVKGLASPELTTIMTALYTRYTRYVELRDALPFEVLLADACVTSTDTSPTGVSFVISVSCAFPESPDATGQVLLEQRTVSTAPRVTEIDIDYVNVTVDGVVVDGTEQVRETDGTEGTSQRTLDLLQNGIALSYAFRLGLLDGEQVVLDYVMKSADGKDILARLTDPQSPGAAATVLLSGVDGTLTCELRNVPWSPEQPARGMCDNGETFGLPADTPALGL